MGQSESKNVATKAPYRVVNADEPHSLERPLLTVMGSVQSSESAVDGMEEFTLNQHEHESDEDLVPSIGVPNDIARASIQMPANSGPDDSTSPKQPQHNTVNARKQRVLIVGGSRVGKSTVINALLNKSPTKEALRSPAITADCGSTNGTTDAVTAYISAKQDRAIVDTIGLTDPRFTRKQVIDNLYNIIFNFRVGLTCTILVVKHDILTSEEERQLRLFTALLGKEWTKSAYLIVTHYEKPNPNVEEYLKQNHSPAFQRVLKLFDPEHILVGSLQIHGKQRVDDLLVEDRSIFVKKIVDTIDQQPEREPIRLRIRNLFDFVKYIRNLFRFDKAEDTNLHRLFKAFVAAGKEERIYFHGFTDSICLEEVRGNNDDMFITPCLHVFHFDCLLVWLLKNDTCPNCRAKIPTSITMREDGGIYGDLPTEEQLRLPNRAPTKGDRLEL